MKLRARNRYESIIIKKVGVAIKIISIDVDFKSTRNGKMVIRLTTLVIKRGYRHLGIGNKILEYLKAVCDEENNSLIAPLGGNTSKQRVNLRRFYLNAGLRLEYIDDYEYYVYNY